MNLSRYLEVRNIVLANAKRIEDSKRQSYTSGNEDVLFNFKSDKEFVGNSACQNVMTHMMKQVRGISSFVQNPDVTPSETLLSRASDLINYAVLMVATAMDEGRDTGVCWLHEKDPLFHEKYGFKEPSPPTTIVDPARVMYLEEGLLDPESWKKFLSRPVYDYTFGKDPEEEPWKD